jgi:hypothetical protein
MLDYVTITNFSSLFLYLEFMLLRIKEVLKYQCMERRGLESKYRPTLSNENIACATILSMTVCTTACQISQKIYSSVTQAYEQELHQTGNESQG